jgi:polysaccharide biosynthesis/export protein
MKNWMKVGIRLWVPLLAVSAMAQGRTPEQVKEAKAVAGDVHLAPIKSAVATQDPNYVIGPQDTLEISVWKEADLTRTVPVRPDGKISLPLLNDVQAAGLTPTQLRAQITEKLKKYVTEPQVTVVVMTINSQRVFMLGEIAKPGAYPLLPGMTVLQAISSAGGFSEYAKTKKIYVLRSDNGKQLKLPFNYKEVVRGSRTEQNILLKAGDTIVVP